MDLGHDERARPPLHGRLTLALLAGGLAHGPLMLSAVFGSVIALERAVALKRSWAFAAPLAAGLGGGAIGAGWPLPAALLGLAYGCPGRNLAPHALGIGFLFSMVMAHAPVIVPAVSGLRFGFSKAWYAPLLLLHASLLGRFPGALHDAALAHAAAIALFAIIVAAHRRR